MLQGFVSKPLLGWQLWDRKTEDKTGFPFIVLKPASSAVGSDGSFLFPAYTSENVLFAYSTSPMARVLASQNMDHDKKRRTYAPLSWESSLPSWKDAGGLCLEFSLETWEPDPFLDLFFPIGNELQSNRRLIVARDRYRLVFFLSCCGRQWVSIDSFNDLLFGQ